MPFKIQVGPAQTSIHQGQTILVTEADGQINWPSHKGLYFLDTRVLSNWNIYANGEPFTLLNGGALNYFSSRTCLTNRTIVTEDGEIAPRILGFVISRSICSGMHEDFEITNNNLTPVRFQLELAIRCDFVDIFEVKSGLIVRRGRITTEWSQGKQELSTCYTNADFARSLTITLASNEPRAVYANGRLSFEVKLGPGEVWCCCLLYTLGDGKQEFAPPKGCAGSSHRSSNEGSLRIGSRPC